jgi:ribosomal protein L11 methyltransferase
MIRLRGGMRLFEFKVEIPYEQAEAADTLLLEQGCEAWRVIEDVLARRAWVAGVAEEAGELDAAWAELHEELAVVGEPVITALANQDWRDSYKAHFQPWRCGRLHWVPTWERETYALPAGDVVIWLDPGMAFGTGNHETTRLCCERLVTWAASPALSPEARVIDAGCGSGILALSAVKLGRRHVVGFDNDPEAVAVSRANAAHNGLAEDAIEWGVGDLVTGLAGRQAELVLANIQADVLMRFARELIGAVAPGGQLVLSGILAIEQAQVREVFARLVPGWPIEGRVLGEWSDLALMRVG